MSQNNDERRWSYEDYESNRERSRSRSPLAGIGIALLILVLLAIIGLSVYGVYTFTRNNDLFPAAPESQPSESVSESAASEESSEASPAEESSSAPAVMAPGEDEPLTIYDRASKEEEEGGELSSVEIVERVKPSIVYITIYSNYDTIRPAGAGSGIIMSEDGYIITNAHVVSSAAAVDVELSNGDSYPAEIVGYDERTDIGVIKIDATDLPVAEFGNSDELRVGERVLTFGNPGGSILAGSVAQGIVSGINRSLSSDSYATSYIQTDAAINPGNSGGALVNAYGQVVGICSAKIVKTSYESIAFAIPINEAQPIINDLIRFGHVTGRAKIGITGQAINETLSQLNGIPTGIYVFSAEEGSDIEEKGIQRGDIITYVDGERVETFTQLGNYLASHKPGDVATLTIFRPGYGAGRTEETFDIDVVLMEDAG